MCQQDTDGLPHYDADIFKFFWPKMYPVAIWHSLCAASGNLSFLPAYYVSARHRCVTHYDADILKFFLTKNVSCGYLAFLVCCLWRPFLYASLLGVNKTQMHYLILSQTYFKFFDQKCILLLSGIPWSLPLATLPFCQPTMCQQDTDALSHYDTDILKNFWPKMYPVAIWHSLFAASGNLSFPFPFFFVDQPTRCLLVS